MNVENLKELLKIKKITNIELAEVLGLSIMSLNRRMRKKSEFTGGEITSILKFLNVSYDDLMFGFILTIDGITYILNKHQKDTLESILSKASKL